MLNFVMDRTSSRDNVKAFYSLNHFYEFAKLRAHVPSYLTCPRDYVSS